MADERRLEKAKCYDKPGEFAPDDEVTFTFPNEDNNHLFYSMCILSRCSLVFRAMFEHDFKEKKDRNVTILDIKRAEFIKFFRVCDPMLVVHITVHDAIRLVEITEKYQHESIIRECRRIMSGEIFGSYELEANKIVDVLSVAAKYGYKELLQKGEDYFVDLQFQTLLNTELFEKMPLDFKYRVLSKRVLKYNNDLHSTNGLRAINMLV